MDLEITMTRHNPLVDPALRLWGPDIAIYLFLSGLAAGTLIIGTLIYMLRKEDALLSDGARRAQLGAPALLGLGMLGLLHNLENRLNVPAFYLHFNAISPKAWGAWGLMFGLTFGAAYGASALPEGDIARLPWQWAREVVKFLKTQREWLAPFTLFVALFLGTYTGVLLSTNVGRPLWNSALLPVIFLVSAVSTAVAMLTLLSREHVQREWLVRLDIPLLITELTLLMLYLISFRFSTAAAHDALSLLTTGPYAAAFWVLVVGIGLSIPLAMESLELRHRISATNWGAVLVLAGGLALRFVVLFAGQASHYRG